MRLLFFELTIALVFLFLSVGICWMAWALPIGLAPTFWVSSGAFPFLLGVILLLLIGALWAGFAGRTESVQETMRDAVLHNVNRIDLFGLMEVTPGLISAFLVTAALLIGAALLRVFAIPRFRYVPGKLQLALEEAVGL